MFRRLNRRPDGSKRSRCDTQDDLRCLRNGIYILQLTSSPCEKNSGERSRAHGPSCLKFGTARPIVFLMEFEQAKLNIFRQSERLFL